MVAASLPTSDAGPDMSLGISRSRASTSSASTSRRKWSEWLRTFTRVSSFASGT